MIGGVGLVAVVYELSSCVSMIRSEQRIETRSLSGAEVAVKARTAASVVFPSRARAGP